MMILKHSIYYLVIAFGILIYIDGYYRIENKKLKLNVNKILLIFIFSLFMLINDIYNISSFKLVINYLITIVLIISVSKTNVKRSMGFVTYLCVSSIVIELIMVLFLSNFINDNNFPKDNFVFKLILSSTYALILSLLFRIKFLNLLVLKIETFFDSSIKTDYIIIFGIIALNVLCVYHKNYFNGINITTFLIFIISLIIILFFFALKEKHKKESQILKSEFLFQTIDNYEIAIKDYKELKHNLINDFLSIKSLVNNECQKLLNEKIKKYSKDYEWIDLVSEIPSGIQGLLFLKAQQAKQKGIKFNIQSSNVSVKDLKMTSKTYAFINDSLGILLDNAIDASSYSKEKNIIINISQEKKEITLEIINKFKHNLNIDMLGTLNYSTKSEKSGIGLNYIKKNRYSHIKFFNKVVNDYFVSTLKLHI